MVVFPVPSCPSALFPHVYVVIALSITPAAAAALSSVLAPLGVARRTLKLSPQSQAMWLSSAGAFTRFGVDEISSSLPPKPSAPALL